MSEKERLNSIDLAKSPKAIIGIVISLSGIYWAFKDFNFIDFKGSIQQIDSVYFLFATIFLWGSVWLRGLRW